MSDKTAAITVFLCAVSTVIFICSIYVALGWAIVHFAMKFW